MTARPVCVYCDARERCQIFEYFEDGAFILDTCCDGVRQDAIDILNGDPKEAAAWLSTLGHGIDPWEEDDDRIDELHEELCATPIFPKGALRRVIDNGCGACVLDFNLRIVPIAWKDARAFIAKHHRHCRPPAGWRFGAAVKNGSRTIGVISVGRPVARKIDHKRVVEVNRLCIRTDIADGLAWNACSLLYGWAAREAKTRGFARIITYIRSDEDGTSVKAAGWTVDGRVRGAKWSRRDRPRDDNEAIDKVRFARELAAIDAKYRKAA